MTTSDGGTDAGGRQEALRRIRDIASAHGLTLGDIRDALVGAESPVSDDASSSTASGLLVRVLGYLGGTFVLAGIIAFVGIQWGGMNSAARVIITLGSGLAIFVMGPC